MSAPAPLPGVLGTPVEAPPARVRARAGGRSGDAGLRGAAVGGEAADLVRALARDAAQRGLSLQDALGLFEAGVIGAHLAVARGNRTLAAATLGYERSHLLRRLRGLGITRSDDE